MCWVQYTFNLVCYTFLHEHRLNYPTWCLERTIILRPLIKHQKETIRLNRLPYIRKLNQVLRSKYQLTE